MKKLPKIDRKYKILFYPFRGYLYRRVGGSSRRWPDCAWTDSVMRLNGEVVRYNYKKYNSRMEFTKWEFYERMNYPMHEERVKTFYELIQYCAQLIFGVLHNKSYNARIIDFLPNYSFGRKKIMKYKK
jgi:hypothetical protein